MGRKQREEETERLPLGLDGLARHYSTPLRRFFERRVRDQSDVPDLVQDVLLRLSRLGNLSSIDKPEHYLFRTASSALRDQARRDAARHRQRHVPFEIDEHQDSDFSPERVLAGKQTLAAVHSTLRLMPERTRDVFVLRVFEEQKTAAVAAALRMSTRSVEMHYAKALALITVAVRGHTGD